MITSPHEMLLDCIRRYIFNHSNLLYGVILHIEEEYRCALLVGKFVERRIQRLIPECRIRSIGSNHSGGFVVTGEDPLGPFVIDKRVVTDAEQP